MVTQVTVCHVVAVWALAVAVSVWVTEGGVLHPEIEERLPILLGDQSLFRIIFDSRMDSIPRPRQVSFLFDVVDAYFVQASARLGYPHFLSFTHYLFSLFIALALWRFMNRYVTSNKWITLLVIALLLSSRSFEMAGFFRTAKAGAALMTAVTINVLADLLTWREPRSGAGRWNKPWVYGLVVFLLAVVGALFDEQSVFMTVLLIGILGLWGLLRQSAVCAMVAGAAVASLGVVFAYYRWVFPRLYAFVNNTPANYDFQTSIPMWQLKTFAIYRDAAGLLVDTARCVLGNVTPFQLSVATAILLAISFVARGEDVRPGKAAGRHASSANRPAPAKETTSLAKPADGWAILLFVVMLGSLWVLNVGMVLKHPAVLWEDVRIGYYWLPAATCIAFGVPWFVARVGQLVPAASPVGRRKVLTLTLVAMIGANLWTLPEHFHVLQTGNIASAFAKTKLLFVALADPDSAQQQYEWPFSDPIYTLLSSRRSRSE